jgi:hypothetical protein
MRALITVKRGTKGLYVRPRCIGTAWSLPSGANPIPNPNSTICITTECQPETVQYKCLYNISILKPKKEAETIFTPVVHEIVKLTSLFCVTKRIKERVR